MLDVAFGFGDGGEDDNCVALAEGTTRPVAQRRK
jgi:hypothetical protein